MDFYTLKNDFLGLLVREGFAFIFMGLRRLRIMIGFLPYRFERMPIVFFVRSLN
jgi:hypothetical protein